MMKSLLLVVLMLLNINSSEAYMMHQEKVEKEWRQESLPPFNELMISWNADRPSAGRYLFYASVKTDTWSPWLLYATWGSEGQTSFLSQIDGAPVRIYQDALEVMEGHLATGFQIRVVPEGDASLDGVHRLHVYTNSDKAQESKQESLAPVDLSVAGLSQMTLPHERHIDLCSPTATTAVVRYLAKNPTIDPVRFAQNSWDKGFDIFGNWVFNVAEASVVLGKEWSCWVERLSGFDAIYQRLRQGTPVVASVRGPLPGSASPYAKGHLMAVIGYDPVQQKVICMDPGFPSDQLTNVRYDLADFVQAWSRRGHITYIFER